jgi:hypothetical protein
MADGNQSSGKWYDPKNLLALVIVAFVLASITCLSLAIISATTDKAAITQTILNMILPLLGTWIGTVLAFYFGKENFESANQSVRELVKQMTSQQKLESIPIGKVMIKFAEMYKVQVPVGKESDDPFRLMILRADLIKSGKGRRLPIVDDQNHPRLVVHQSAIDEFIAKKMDALTTDELKALTLRDLLDDKIGILLDASLVTLKESDTLARAKEEMDKTKFCQDVFITANGTTGEAVVGWVTNGIIEDNSKV